MWYKTGLLCGLLLALLARSPRADVQCDGVDDLLTSALALSSFMTTTTFTLTAHVQSTGSTFPQDACWLDGPMLSDSGLFIAFGRGGIAGGACVMTYSGEDHKIFSPITSGGHHLAARLNAGALELFVDGVNVVGTGSAPQIDLTGTLMLCGNPDAHSPDRITEVKVYDVALSNVQIEQEALSRLRQVSGPTPTAYWPLDDCPDGASGHGVSFKDRSGNGRDVTGNHGGDVAGLTCHASGHLSQPWGIQ